MKQLRPIMIVGTGSDVGKSVINAGLCRIFYQDGYSPAPFKAQNMSLNSYATPEGLEIGRAQAVQAEACGIPGSSDMNPVLLKPTGDLSSQVVLHGKPIGNRSASEYFMGTDREWLFSEALAAFNRLQERHNPVVMEGAGSISEMNLWDKDITNMKMALKTGAATYLVADIDRGGIFGSVYGTISLLPQDEKDLIKGIIINKFRGDPQLFTEGKSILEEISGKPVVGVIPFFKDIFVEQEDSVVLENKHGKLDPDRINIVVVLLQHMSNFTDFDSLDKIEGINLFFSVDSDAILKAEMLIIPGSKNTISDLQQLKDSGIARLIQIRHKEGKAIYGICGGFQMMGREIRDPQHVEGKQEHIDGLNILPVSTALSAKKKTEQCQFTVLNHMDSCQGYKIHMGETNCEADSPLCRIGETGEGYYLNDNTWGTYIHGIFDNSVVVRHVLSQVSFDGKVIENYHEYKDTNFNRLSDLLRASLDMDYIYKTLHI